MKLKPAALLAISEMVDNAIEANGPIKVEVPKGALPTEAFVLVVAPEGITAQRLAPSPLMSLSAAEDEALDEAGFTASDDVADHALARSGLEYQRLLRQALTVEQAAKKLGVTPGRLRQRLAARTLLGVKDGAAWRIPTFQLVHGEIARGLDEVLPAIRPDAHPLAVQSWLTVPHADLLDEHEHPVAPLVWLAAGRSTEPVVELASEV